MIERRNVPEDAAGHAAAEAGFVILDGPNGVAVAMTPDAADGTAESVTLVAGEARKQNQDAG